MKTKTKLEKKQFTDLKWQPPQASHYKRMTTKMRQLSDAVVMPVLSSLNSSANEVSYPLSQKIMVEDGIIKQSTLKDEHGDIWDTWYVRWESALYFCITLHADINIGGEKSFLLECYDDK